MVYGRKNIFCRTYVLNLFMVLQKIMYLTVDLTPFTVGLLEAVQLKATYFKMEIRYNLT